MITATISKTTTMEALIRTINNSSSNSSIDALNEITMPTQVYRSKNKTETRERERDLVITKRLSPRLLPPYFTLENYTVLRTNLNEQHQTTVMYAPCVSIIAYLHLRYIYILHQKSKKKPHPTWYPITTY